MNLASAMLQGAAGADGPTPLDGMALSPGGNRMRKMCAVMSDGLDGEEALGWTAMARDLAAGGLSDPTSLVHVYTRTEFVTLVEKHLPGKGLSVAKVFEYYLRAQFPTIMLIDGHSVEKRQAECRDLV